MVVILFDRCQTAEEVKHELKLSKGLSSNIEGDGPMASEMRYARQNYTPKRRRLSSKNLQQEAESISYESYTKQRIYSADNN